MNINTELFNGTDKILGQYDCPNISMKEFLQATLDERSDKSLELIKNIMNPHNKKKLFEFIVELLNVESGINMDKIGRDHVSHSILCFILGIYINELYFKKKLNIPFITEFEWKLASLFHDIGYPFQISNKIQQNFVDKTKSISRELGIGELNIKLKAAYIEGIENLTDNRNSLSIIQDRLDMWDLKIDANKEYRNRIEKGEVCHGIISALCMLKILDALYKKHNTNREYKTILISGSLVDANQQFFDESIVSASSAIFIHNLDADSFNNNKLNVQKSTLAYLLKLSDCLQTWERPNLHYNIKKIQYKTGSDFCINIKDSTLVFTVLNDLRNEEKSKLKKELEGCLDIDVVMKGDNLIISIK